MGLEKLNAYTKLISALNDRPNLSASELKQYFDSSPEEIRVAFNNAVDALQSTQDGDSGADNIGATPLNANSGSTVQAILEYLKSEIDSVASAGIADGSITDAKLSNAAGQIKYRVNQLDNANYLLNKIKTVDGAGSGLDADMLDGKHASDFVLASEATKFATGTYVGDGTTSRFINVGFTPKLVKVLSNDSSTQGIWIDSTSGGRAYITSGNGVIYLGGFTLARGAIVTNGFNTGNDGNCYGNANGKTYVWEAIG